MKNELTETIDRVLVRVEVNDDFRVEVAQLKRRLDYTPTEAADFARMLFAAAEEAQRMLEVHTLERHERTVAGALGSDLVPDGQPEPGGTENPGDGRTAARVLEMRHAAGWPPEGYPAGVTIRVQCGGWPAECNCETAPTYDGTRIVFEGCLIHGRKPVDRNGDYRMTDNGADGRTAAFLGSVGLRACECERLADGWVRIVESCPVHQGDSAGDYGRADKAAAAHAAPRGMQFADREGK